MNKAKYLGMILILLVLVFGLTLFSYYYQDFDVNYNFVESVDGNDVEVNFGSGRDAGVLVSAQIPIGSIDLTNNGYFTEKYSSPRLFGCVVHAEDSIKKIESVLWVGKSSGQELRYYGQTSSIEAKLAPGKNVSIDVKLSLDNYGKDKILKSDMQDGSLKVIGVNVYSLPNLERNPLFRTYEREEVSCDLIDSSEDPIAFIEYSWVWLE